MPVWVQLYSVPLELYSRRGLSYIASAIGYPLYMDTITASKERLEFAKVCVEIAAGARIPRAVVTTVKVSVPWMPACCSKCKTFGHTVSACVVENPHTHKEWVVKSKDADVLSFPLGSLEEKGDSSNNPLNDKTFVDSTVHDVEDVTEAETYAMVRNTVVSIGVSNVVGTNKEKSNSENIFSKDSTVLEVDEVNKVILDSNLGDFPPLQDSVMKKKGNEKGAKGDKSKGGFAGSKNRFDILNGVGSEGPKIVPEGMTRKPRAAVMGVANLLQEMKAKKKDNLEKIKGSCVDVANQSAWDIVGADYSAAVRTEPVKSFEIRSGKLGSKFHSTSLVRAAQVPSLLQLKDIAFPSSLTAIQSVFKPAAVSPPLSPPHLSPINSRSTSPYSSKPSPPRSSTSSFSKDVIESLRDQMNF
ncbi:hypothetical protein V6N13_040992 [Hibiscus sabdariffa]